MMINRAVLVERKPWSWQEGCRAGYTFWFLPYPGSEHYGRDCICKYAIILQRPVPINPGASVIGDPPFLRRQYSEDTDPTQIRNLLYDHSTCLRPSKNGIIDHNSMHILIRIGVNNRILKFHSRDLSQFESQSNFFAWFGCPFGVFDRRRIRIGEKADEQWGGIALFGNDFLTIAIKMDLLKSRKVRKLVCYRLCRDIFHLWSALTIVSRTREIYLTSTN